MPSDDNQTKTQEPEHTPILLDEDNVHYKGGPPYVLIFILIFIILSSFWKVFMVNKNKDKANNAAPSVTQTQTINR